ncbi:ABC transporter permease [Streptococcus ovuberis]|uniref:ABC transporter permease n=1 Tax=Streptococcus ovuberis TaxID=1936207 RepID=A0A7X6MZM8_9STRE|nr:ABC transporter permease [Streptococcus ovuberis]NKZ20738.1 ABC transporter permease [Streptococcus ovuberis]
MWTRLVDYLAHNSHQYLTYLWEHIWISLLALGIALVLGTYLGYLAYQRPKLRQAITGLSGGLRVIPSLGVLFFLIPLIGVGQVPALIALVLLGLPPIILQTLVGLVQVPESLKEVGKGLGMTDRQVLLKVAFPLALPHLLTGLKLALVEIIASASLATYIGAGGLGTLIFTGLGLYRYDLLLLGGGSVALLSLIAMLSLDGLIHHIKQRH